MNSQIHKVRLIDIDHDVLSDDESKKAHCTFEFSNLLSDSSGYSIATLWNTSGDNNSTNYDYLNSDLRKALDGQGTGTLRWYQKGLGTKATDPDYTKAVIDMLPSELKNNIKTVKKEVVTGSSYSTKNYNANVFALTYREMTKNGSSSYAKEEGKTYKYYVDNDDNASRVKHQIKWHTEAVTSKKQITDLNWNPSSYAGYNSDTPPEGGYYWFASPHIRGKSGAWSAGMSGALNFYDVYEVAFAVAPAFCI